MNADEKAVVSRAIDKFLKTLEVAVKEFAEDLGNIRRDENALEIMGMIDERGAQAIAEIMEKLCPECASRAEPS